MAEITSKASLLAAGYGGYAGWGETEALADYRATGGQGKRDPFAPSAAAAGAQPSLSELSQELTRQRIAAAGPAIESLQASLPEIGQRYEAAGARLGAEQQPLLDRYQNLIGELKGRETKETATQAQALAQTFGRRGLTTEGGLYQGALAERTGDISQFYGGQIKETTLAQEADVRDIRNQMAQLTEQRVESDRAIRNQIAQLQAGGANQAIVDANTLMAQQQDRAFQSRLDDLQKRLLEAQIKKEGQAEPTKLQAIEAGEGLYSFDPTTGQLKFLQRRLGGSGDTNDPFNLYPTTT